MRSQNRKILNEPMRSPSPDIANRSVITHTKSPISDVKNYMRMRDISPSSKHLNMPVQITLPLINQQNEIARLKLYIQELQRRIQELMKFTHNNGNTLTFDKELTGQKNLINRQQQKPQSSITTIPMIHKLSPYKRRGLSPKITNFPKNEKLFLPKVCGARQNFPISNISNSQCLPMQYINSQYIQLYQQIRNQTELLNRNQFLIKEMNQRIISMAGENHRLCEIIQSFSHQRNFRRQNINYKDQIQQTRFSHQQHPNQSSIYPKHNNKESLQQPKIKYSLQQPKFNTIKNDRSKSFGDLKNLPIVSQRNHQYSNDQKQSFKSGRTDKMNDYLELLMQYFTSQAEKMSQQHKNMVQAKTFQINSRIKKIQQKLLQNSQKLHKSYSPIFKANQQIMQTQQSMFNGTEIDMLKSKYLKSPSPINQLNMQFCSPVKQKYDQLVQLKKQNQKLTKKLHYLQSQLKNSLLHCRQLQIKLSHLQISKSSQCQNQFPLVQKLQSLQQQIKSMLLQVQFKSQTINELQHKNQQLIQKQIKSQQQIQALKQQIQRFQDKLKVIQFQKITVEKFQHIKEQLNQMKENHQLHKVNWDKYLDMVLQIRYSITSEGVDHCLQQIDSTYQTADQLQLEILKIKQTYQVLIQNFRKKLLQKDEAIALLQRSQQMSKSTICQMNMQRESLLNSIYQYKIPLKTSLNEQQLQRKFSQIQNRSRPCQMRSYITKTVNKIQNLQNQINKAIRQNENVRRHKKSVEEHSLLYDQDQVLGY